ncbi:hypothetical protein LEA_02544, partial [human gut metagenome]
GALSFTLEQSALLEHGGRQATATIRGVDDAYGAVFQLGDAVSAGEWRVRLGDLERLVVGQSMAWMLGIRSLADADVTLYAVRRGSFSSLLPLENYTRRTEPVGGVYTLDLETERTYVLASLRLAQELFGYPGPRLGARRVPRSRGRCRGGPQGRCGGCGRRIPRPHARRTARFVLPHYDLREVG